MADETIDFSDRAELATFVRYIESDSHDVKEEFLGLVQIIGIKMLPKYVKKEKIIIIIIKKITNFFWGKGIDCDLAVCMEQTAWVVR